jgi:putative heme-binding domain-containing protein
MHHCVAACVLFFCAFALPCSAEELDYAPADDDLKVVKIDSSEKESFFAVRADTMGRLFVGCREALLVYEPNADGSYAPPVVLYRFAKDTWINDIAVRGHDLYVLTVAALYVVPGAVTNRAELKPERLVWGVPLGHVHQCFHGLAWGPEGDLYLSMGDPVWYYGDFNRPDHWGHWSFFSVPVEGMKEATVESQGKHWVRTPYNGVGGVFRCRADGSKFQVVATGLRNSCGLAFDHDWNLFTNDNDHEGMPAQYVPGRLVHVVPHVYYSWPRGWLLSKTPERADLVETLNENLGRYVPVGQAYYDETFLPERFRNNLLVARWCIKSITRYPLVAKGSTFKADEFHVLDGRDQARPVGVCVGRGGRIFATICYMAQNEGSPIYKSDLVMITRKDDPPTAPFEPYDAVAVDEKFLFNELHNPSWHRRYAAHVELFRRDALQAVEKRVAARAAGASADSPKPTASPSVASVHALIARFDQKETPETLAMDRIDAASRDTYVRHLATMRLARQATVETLQAMCDAKEPASRLGGVLATGFRLTVPVTTAEVPAGLKLDKLRDESNYVIQFADGKEDLRTLGPVGVYTIADAWKQTSHTPEQETLFAMLMKSAGDPDEQVRLQAVHFLSVLNDPRSEPTVEKVITANEERRLATAKLTNITQVWLAGPFDDGDQGFKAVHDPERGPIELSSKYTEGSRTVEWQEKKTQRQFDLQKEFGPCDHSSFYAYFRIESGHRQRAHLLVGSDDGVKVWQNGKEVWANDVTRGALPFQDLVPVELEAGSNDFLVRVRNVVNTCQLYLTYRSLADVAIVLPEKIEGPSLAERLKNASDGSYKVPDEFLSVDWAAAVKEGNADRGKALFESIGCAKCHAVSAEAQGTGGPSLADTARRFTVSHLVESILTPNRQISPVFRATQIVTTDGRQIIGLVVGETAEKIELLQADTKRVTLAKSEIEERALQNISPMPQGVVRKPDELRDLLAFLLRGK